MSLETQIFIALTIILVAFIVHIFVMGKRIPFRRKMFMMSSYDIYLIIHTFLEYNVYRKGNRIGPMVCFIALSLFFLVIMNDYERTGKY